jgi:hypothetical protein
MKKNTIVSMIIIIFLINVIHGCTEENQISIEYIQVDPLIIQKGETANLSWQVIGAKTVIIDNNIGYVKKEDTMIISPIENTTYTITATYQNEMVNSSITIIVEEKKQEKDTPKVTMSANSFNKNSSVLIKIHKISKKGVEWSTTSGKITNENNQEIIAFISMDWRPNGFITERDEIIITNSMIKPKFIPETNYSFILTYQLTNEIMGKTSWIQ